MRARKYTQKKKIELKDALFGWWRLENALKKEMDRAKNVLSIGLKMCYLGGKC